MKNKEEQTAPKLRFKGYTDAWQQRKLGEISTFYSGGTPKVGEKKYYNGNIPFIRSAEINKAKTELYISEIGLKESSAKLVNKNTILYALYGATSGEVGLAKIKGAINQAVLAIEPYHFFSQNFIYQYLKKEKIKINKKYLQGGQGNLSANIIKNLNLLFPQSLEQDNIGSLLSKVDHHLYLLQKEVKLKTLLKQDLLQKLLTITENNVPKIRLKNYNDFWKSTTLGEVAKIKTGSRNHQDSIPNGKYPFFVRSEKIEHLNEFDFNERAILVPGDGKIGEIFHYYQGKFALHQRVYKIDDFKDIEPLFLLNLFKNNFKRHALRLNAQGTVPSLRLPMFTKWKIILPSLSEQKHIANLLNKVDKSIELDKRKIQSLTTLKQFLLQNMFI